MSQLLKPKQQLKLDANAPCQVEHFLGGGGQGEVYQINLNGQPSALKWYFPAQATPEQREALEILIKKGAPNGNFLWPSHLMTAANITGFGYLMPIRPSHYKSIVDLMKRRVEPTFRAVITACMELAHSFLQLHAKGLCYRDISFGNVFFDPQLGAILICDNDNVTVDGQGHIGVLGTPRFMAPEIVRGEALPSTQTDLFSLAVLLFYMLFLHHPLEGKKEAQIKCFDLPAMNKLYGTEPLFIFDPQDIANRPIPGLHDNAILYWPIYPQFLREMFINAFTRGLRDPQHGRVRESEWRAVLVQLRDSIIYCNQCGAENFYDTELFNSKGQLNPCWSCQKTLVIPPRIQIDKQIIALNHDTQLFPHHLDSQKSYDFSKSVATVARHPQNPRLWGLKNLSPEKWVLTKIDGKMMEVMPGQSAKLDKEITIQFGKTTGKIL
ncbi:MAG: serine/threonine protein kinase [Beggiatoa sp. IS2]|nr:MAG: serine/threonine protein kinase [Beggiatoa sp. IS2]